MNCCCPYSRSASRFFSFFAGSYRQRFEKKGFEPSQKQLMAGLAQVGYQDASVLEIGSGVGHVHLSMLEQGAASAVGIELSEKMNGEARLWSSERHLGDRTEYLDGDFMELTDTVTPADVAVMDKVVCCYPDVDGLVHRSLEKTRRVYALTYPRDRWIVRFGVGVLALSLRLLRSDFRPYVHDPLQIEKWIVEAGYSKQYEAKTFVWLTQVYIKEAQIKPVL